MSTNKSASPDPVTIYAKLALAVAKWAYQVDDRPNLQNVMFGGGEMMAVDGHRLVRAPIEYGGPRFGIKAPHLTAAITALLAMDDHRRRVNGDTVLIAEREPNGMTSIGFGVGSGWTHSPSVRLPYTDGHDFPNMDLVMPNERPDKSPDGYGFNPKYLAAIAEVEHAAGARDGCNIVKVTGWSADALGGMLFEGYRGIRYVIMPGRV